MPVSLRTALVTRVIKGYLCDYWRSSPYPLSYVDLAKFNFRVAIDLHGNVSSAVQRLVVDLAIAQCDASLGDNVPEYGRRTTMSMAMTSDHRALRQSCGWNGQGRGSDE